MSAESPQGAPSLQSLRRRGVRAVVFLAVFVGLLVPTVYWVEAEKEAHVLCGMARLGVPEEDVVRIFRTAELLRVQTVQRGDTLVLRAATPIPVGRARCEVRMPNGVVQSASRETLLPTVSIATFALLICVPLAWRGRRARKGVKVALGIGTLLLVVAALQRVGVPQLAALAEASSSLLAAALVTTVAIATRDASAAQTPSHWRRIIAPTIVALACAILLLSPPTL